MDNNSMEELRMLVTRLERRFDQQRPTNQDVNSRFERMAARWDAMAERWDAMAARWDGYIVELRQMNERLQTILERLLRGGGANGGETAP
jgi:hypothetical protein